jgi:RNA polymerase sigma factor (sigma-70 family)
VTTFICIKPSPDGLPRTGEKDFMMSYDRFNQLCKTAQRMKRNFGNGVDLESEVNQALLLWARKQSGVTVEQAIAQIDVTDPPPQFLAICHNKIVDDFRRSRRIPKTLSQIEQWDSFAAKESVEKDEALPPSLSSKKQSLMLALESCFKKANPKTRQAVELKLKYGCTAREISELLNLSQTAVETRISRFRRNATREYARAHSA